MPDVVERRGKLKTEKTPIGGSNEEFFEGLSQSRCGEATGYGVEWIEEGMDVRRLQPGGQVTQQ